MRTYYLDKYEEDLTVNIYSEAAMVEFDVTGKKNIIVYKLIQELITSEEKLVELKKTVVHRNKLYKALCDMRRRKPKG